MTTWLVHLSPSECQARLEGATLGRLGVIVNGRPEVFPVNHVVEAATGRVAFPTHEGTKLRGAVDWPWVAFEVDGLDSDGASGWSVMVVGRAEEITDPDELERLRSQRGHHFFESDAEHWLRITPSKITGRHVSAA